MSQFFLRKITVLYINNAILACPPHCKFFKDPQDLHITGMCSYYRITTANGC